ncbi:hypothetical protein, partial [Burkholderia multivorans]|uniref:hypothetical protein n=1 Tax=Burkholderia multivorans TaxID=87883 RepID=UPI0021C187C7
MIGINPYPLIEIRRRRLPAPGLCPRHYGPTRAAVTFLLGQSHGHSASLTPSLFPLLETSTAIE